MEKIFTTLSDPVWVSELPSPSKSTSSNLIWLLSFVSSPHVTTVFPSVLSAAKDFCVENICAMLVFSRALIVVGSNLPPDFSSPQVRTDPSFRNAAKAAVVE